METDGWTNFDYGDLEYLLVVACSKSQSSQKQGDWGIESILSLTLRTYGLWFIILQHL